MNNGLPQQDFIYLVRSQKKIIFNFDLWMNFCSNSSLVSHINYALSSWYFDFG